MLPVEASNAVLTNDLWKAFGYKEHSKLKRVVLDNIELFEAFGGVRMVHSKPSKGGKGGRPSESYALNMDHLLMLTALVKNSSSSKKTELIPHLVGAYASASLLSIYNVISTMDLSEIDKDKYVYVARESESGRYKIGISINPEERIKSLNTGNPEQLILVHAYLAIESGYKSESLAHALFEGNRLKGEWFDKTIDLRLLPSYSATHIDGAECDCYDCSTYRESLYAIDSSMTRDEAITAIVNNTNNDVEAAIRHADALIDTGELME